MTSGFAKEDSNKQARLETIGLIVYVQWLDEAKAKKKGWKNRKRLILRGNEYGPQPLELIEQIMNTIAHE